MVSVLTLVPFLTLFLCSISWAWLLRKSRTRSWRPPPGPPAVPLLGHLHLLKRGAPNQVLMDLAKKYGPIFFMRFGSVPVVVASSPESARQFLKTHDASFASRPPSTAARLLTYNKDMVFAPYGDRWRHLRRLATLELFTARRLETFQQERAEEIRYMLESISSLVGSNVDIRWKLKQLTFNMITRMIMSKRYFGENVQDTKEAEEFIHVVDEITKLSGGFSIGEFLPYLRWLDLDGIEARFKKVAANTDAFMQRIISEREANKTQRDKSVGSMDFVDIMLQLRDNGEQIMQGDTIRGLMINLIGAGTDTSSGTVEWALAELVKQPLLLSKAQDEIVKVVGANQLVEEGHLSQMPFLQAIVKETFRLHPAAPLLLPHEAIEDCNVMGYDIAARTTIIINAYAIHRDPSVWKDPLEFKPEKFLDGQVDVRGQDFQLIPFGSGRRICPGLSLGLITVQLALANLLHAFDWEVPPGEVVDTKAEAYGLTVPPGKTLELMCRPRLPVIV